MIDQPGPEFEDPMVCFCHWIRQSKIKKVIAEGAETHFDIQRKTGAATGCGGCYSIVSDLLEDELKSRK